MPNNNKKSNNNVNKHTYMQTNETFINPYNFVSFPKEFKRSKFVSGNLTGYLSISLKTKSPVFIPNTTNDDYFNVRKEGHKSFDFYSYADLSNEFYKDGIFHSPVIPGSEIRGVLRTLHEIQNDSCYAELIDLKRTFAKRCDPPTGDKTAFIFEPYFVFWNSIDNKYHCYKSSSYKPEFNYSNPNCFYRENSDLPLDDKDLTIEDVSGENIIYYRVGESFSGKRSNKIYKYDSKCSSNSHFVLKDEEVLSFKNLLDEYSDERINNHLKSGDHSGYNALIKKFKEKRPILVFICTNNTSGFKLISPASIGKYMLPRGLKYFLRNYKSCSSIDNSCPTCQLFGFVNSDTKNTHSSRIRITDALTNEQPSNCYLSKLTLKPLLSPYISNALFYGLKNDGNNELDDWSNLGASIRGRKLYFHNKFNSKYKDNEPSNLNITIRPVKEGIVFNFKIYFDGINEEQLKQLIKCVNLYNNNNEEKYCHKIGHAKPFGFGSVFMKVEEVVFRKIVKNNVGITYVEEKDDKIVNVSFEPLTIQEKQLQVMTDISFNEENISYPYAENDNNGYAWFTNNKAPDMYTRKQRQCLPIFGKVCNENNAKDKLKMKVNKKI